MNRNFGKLNDGNLTYAPETLRVGDTFKMCPTAADYASQGWLPVIDEKPSEKVGVYYVPTGWEERDGAIWRTYREEPIIAPTPVYKTEELIDGLRLIGKWKVIKAMLDEQDVLELFCARQTVGDSEMWQAMFPQVRQTLVAQGILTDEQIDSILTEAEVR